MINIIEFYKAINLQKNINLKKEFACSVSMAENLLKPLKGIMMIAQS